MRLIATPNQYRRVDRNTGEPMVRYGSEAYSAQI